MSLGGMMQRNPSNMSHDFARVPKIQNPRSSFTSPYEYKTTFNGGQLIPFYVDHALPGDTFNTKFSFFARLLSPLSTALMDNLYIGYFFFYVPYRILQTNWIKLMGEQVNPSDSIDYLAPAVQWAASTESPQTGSLYDYFGVPVNISSLTDLMSINNFAGRGYNAIWNQYFRDENLQDSVTVPLDDGPDTASDFVVLNRGKRHDYLTSCLPFAQKGDSVVLPLGGTAPIVITGGDEVKVIQDSTFTSPTFFAGTMSTGNPLVVSSLGVADVTFDNTGGTGSLGLEWFNPGLQVDPVTLNEYAYADLNSVSLGTSINTFRQAVAMQQLLERDARGGTRYTELLRVHFGVTSPDSRLQRPEFLGGGEQRVSINPVAQTSATVSGSPQASLAAFATAQAHSGFSRSFVEHGVVIGLCSIRADLTYQQGLDRHWSKFSRYDYYWPTFAGLGEQEVLNQEIYFQGISADDSETFGFQERYGEYRYKQSLVTGQFRSSYSQPLDSWHLAEKFTSLPVLGDTFIQDDTATKVNRVIAVGDTDASQFLLDVFGTLRYVRPMPLYGVPGLTRL